MQVRGGNGSLNVQPLEVVTTINTLYLAAKKNGGKRVTYWFQGLNEQPFFVGNVVLERSL